MCLPEFEIALVSSTANAVGVDRNCGRIAAADAIVN